jgi:ADP-ribose pyrophosphatase YjhB (NUDIX family)
MNSEDWLARVKRLRAIAQTGLAYSQDPYDLERYQELQGHAEQMLAALANTSPQRIHDLYLPDTGYPTPKIDVRGGVFRDGRILLVQERADACWALPGGWADEDEAPRGCIEREVMEESGYVVRADRLVAVKDRHLHPYQASTLHRVYKLMFLCELLGGAAATSIETSGAEFFAPDQLPELSLGRTIPDDIRLLLAHHSEPGMPCYVD